MKPSVYIETTIPSYLVARESRDVVVAGHQQITHQWWQHSSGNYDLFTIRHRNPRRTHLMINTDSIVEEVRSNREAIFKECGFDLEQFDKRARQQTDQLKQAGWQFSSRPIAKIPSFYETASTEPHLLHEDPPAIQQP